MYKKRKKKKKKPDDGGMTLEHLKYYYPKVEELRKGYISLSLEERQYITDRMLRKGMNNFYAAAILEAVLLLVMSFLFVADIGKTEDDTLLYVWLVVGTVGAFLCMYIALQNRNKKQLNSIDFDKVEEVLFILGKNNNAVLFFQWDEEKQKFYQRESRSDIFVLGRYGDIMYHPHGTKLFIPKNKGLQA